MDPDAVTVEVYALTGEQFVLEGTRGRSERVHSLLLSELSLTAAELLISDF